MNSERPSGTDLKKPLADYMALLFDAVEFDSDVPAGAEGDREPSPEVSQEPMSADEVRSAYRPVDPHAPTFSEIGSYFAMEISQEAEIAVMAAARLGPRRVLALLA